MANNISIDADFVINEQPDIQADLHINSVPDVSNFVTREELAEDLADKQDVLTAGDNITIDNNIISATDTTYTAGTGISIENGVISNTQTSAEWGNIQGDIQDQTDLIDLIDTKIDIEATARENNDLALQNGINTLNDDLTAEISNRGTADGILQDNIDNHITDKNNPHEVTKEQIGLGNVDNTSDLNKPISTATQNALNTKVSNTREINGYPLSSDITLTASDVGALPDTTTINNLTTAEQQSALNSGANTTNIGQIATNTQNISNEVTNRQNADNALQSQIDALVVASDVFDIVGTYAELQAYDISTVPVNDIIKVLVDSTHNNAATYYRCVENDNVKSWSYIGAEGAYYTKSEADGRFVEQTTTVNGQALSNNITLDAEDVGALPDTTTIGNGTLTIQKNGSTIDIFGANDTGNTTVNISVPTDTSDLTNNAGFITGINSNDVTTALGYIPYDSSNPSGYTSNTGTVTSVNNVSPVNGNVTISIPTNSTFVDKTTSQEITADKTFKGNKLLKFKQGSSNDKLGFTLYSNGGDEKGYLEYNPSNTVDNAPLMTLGNYATSSENITHVGFRRYSSVSGVNGAYNLLTPLIADAKTPFSLTTTYTNFYLPLGFTDGTTTVKTAKSGVVDLSTLMPDISGKQDVSNLVTSISSLSTDTQYPSAKCVYDLVGGIETLLNTINSGTTAEPNITIDTTNNTITFKTAYLNEKGGSFPTTQDEYTFARSTTAYFGINFIDTTFATYKLTFNGCSFTGAGEIDLYLQYNNGELITMDTQNQDSFAKITVIDPSSVSNAPTLVSAEEL